MNSKTNGVIGGKGGAEGKEGGASTDHLGDGKKHETFPPPLETPVLLCETPKENQIWPYPETSEGWENIIHFLDKISLGTLWRLAQS